ncbi:hypothetical protein EOE48_28360, partial [Methylobacterium oryzihabitans]
MATVRPGPAVLTALALVLLALGWPGAAAALAPDPAWRGTALYAAGRYGEAAASFAAVPGARAAY